MSPRLAACFVNHNSGAWCVRAVESLIAEWRAEGREREDLEIVVVDSGSRSEERTWWQSLENLGAEVKVAPGNVGYARGINLAYAGTRGRPDDLVAVLNPDLYFLPGSLAPLIEALGRNEKIGAVAPRLWVDEDRSLLLPPNDLPTPLAELSDLVSLRVPTLGRLRAHRRSRRALAWWSDEGPRRAGMLSGACLFMTRRVADALEGPFDDHFPLYYEDADLCQCIGELGLELLQVPTSHVLHHWSRSAGFGEEFQADPSRRHAMSRSIWYRKECGNLLEHLTSLARRRLSDWIRRKGVRPMHDFAELGECFDAPNLAVGTRADGPARDWLLELSVTPTFSLAAGVLGRGAEYRIGSRSWSWIFPGRWYARALDWKSGKLLAAWTFVKSSPARSWPVDPRVVSMAAEESQPEFRAEEQRSA